MTAFKEIFKENQIALQDDEVKAERFDNFYNRRLKNEGFSYLNSRRSYAATRYELKSMDPSSIQGYLGKSSERLFNAVFNVKKEQCTTKQEGENLIIEVPNETKTLFRFHDAIDVIEKFDYEKDDGIKAYLGEKLDGTPAIANFTQTPHMLIAGSIGSGKSVCVQNVLLSLMYAYTKEQAQFVLVDIKKTELGGYKDISNVRAFYDDRKEALNAMDALLDEMNKRNDLFAEMGCRKLSSYNKQVSNKEKLPEVFLVVEECDTFLDPNAGSSKKIQEKLTDRLMQLAKVGRSAGFHLIIISQKPSGKTIGTDIRSQLGIRIALRMNSSSDSRMVLNVGGAEKLHGEGDAILWTESDNDRMQIAYIDDDELTEAIKWLKENK